MLAQKFSLVHFFLGVLERRAKLGREGGGRGEGGEGKNVPETPYAVTSKNMP